MSSTALHALMHRGGDLTYPAEPGPELGSLQCQPQGHTGRLRRKGNEDRAGEDAREAVKLPLNAAAPYHNQEPARGCTSRRQPGSDVCIAWGCDVNDRTWGDAPLGMHRNPPRSKGTSRETLPGTGTWTGHDPTLGNPLFLLREQQG